jgi:ACT domain-containing protein
MAERDWHQWHEAYDEPGSVLARRLDAVQERVRIALDDAPGGPIRILSMVAGQARDLIPVLATHPRRHDVTARLVELDPRNADAARSAIKDAGLTGVEVVVGDAALIDHYRDLAPADIVLVCGLFGNITDEDIEHTIRHVSSLTTRGGTVIWTRHRREPDLVPQIVDWFAEEGFETLWISELTLDAGVGAHRATREPKPFVTGTTLFTFVGLRILRPEDFPS